MSWWRSERSPVSGPTDLDAWVAEHWDPQRSVREWWRALFDAGLSYPSWPVGLGGLGLSAREARQITEALARHGVIGPPTGNMGAGLAAPTILAHGTEEQIATHVGAIARGERSWCQLFSEPGSGSDLASLGARAIRDGDEWVITGQKVWNSRADESDMGLLLARTNVEVPKHAGITYFLIDMHQPGVEVRPLRTMADTTPFCEVFLTEARVSADQILGGQDAGWSVAQTTLHAERNMVAGGGHAGLVAARAGIHGDLDRTCEEVLERARASSSTARPILRSGAVPAKVMIQLAADFGANEDPLIRQELARYITQIRVNGWTMQRSALAKGQLTGADGSIAKLTTARICQESRDLSYGIVGPAGTLSGSTSPINGELQTVNLSSPGNRLGGGTDEIQLNVIAERALGLPREPSADKDVPYRDLSVGSLTPRGS